MLRRRNKKHSKELKIKAVEEFLAINGSQREICRKYEISSDKQLREWIKLYLSAILDLYDKRIVSYQIGAGNNNPLVFDTFDDAVKENTKAHPLFHSDRGYQYTSKLFYAKLEAVHMRQSMSRFGHCIDNEPMESFWEILKFEMYYLHKFTSADELVAAIEGYITFYNTRRYQRRLHCMTPMEFHYAIAV